MYHNVAQRDILVIEAKKNYSALTTVHNRGSMVLTPLKSWMDILSKDDFAHIHRSFIVNINHVTKFDNTHLVLSNGQQVPIGDGYRRTFFQKIVVFGIRRSEAEDIVLTGRSFVTENIEG